MSSSSVITLAQLKRAMQYVKVYHDGGEPLVPTTGTVVINGDLDTDLIVNGNIEVSGTISGNATASGTITYGELTGTTKENTTLVKCDVSVDGGTLTFAASLSKNNGVFYTEERVTNASAATTSIYSDLTIYTSSNYALYNSGGTFVIKDGATVNATSTNSSGYGVYSTNSFTVYGMLNATATGDSGCGLYVNSSFTIYGTVNAEGISKGVHTYYGSSSTTKSLQIYGTLNATATGDSGNGIHNDNYSSIYIQSSGTVNAKGASHGVYNYGTSIYFYVDGILNTTATGATGTGFFNGNCRVARLTVNDGGIVNATGIRYGVHNSMSGGGTPIVTVNSGGTLNAIATGEGGSGVYNYYNSATFNISGTLNAEGVLYGIYSSGSSSTSAVFTVSGVASATATGESGQGVINTNFSTFTLTGTLYANAASDDLCVNGTITINGDGKIYYNGILQE